MEPFIAEHYRTTGRLPSGGTVRAHFGKGSNSTFVGYVRRYEKENLRPESTVASGSAFLAALEQCVTALRGQHDLELLGLKTDNYELRDRVVQLEDDLDDMAKGRDRAEASLAALGFSSEHARDDAEANRSLAAKVELEGSATDQTGILARAAGMTVAVMREDAALSAAAELAGSIGAAPQQAEPTKPLASNPPPKIPQVRDESRSEATLSGAPRTLPGSATTDPNARSATPNTNTDAVRTAPPPDVTQGARSGSIAPSGGTVTPDRKDD